LSGFLIVPMDRLGVVGVQENAMDAIKEINSLIADGKKVFWLTCDTRFVTEDFPEGHVYGPGGFVVTCSDEVKERLTAKGIIHSEIKGEPANNASLKQKNIGLYMGQGTAEFCWKPLMEVLDLAGFPYKPIDDKDIRKGLLSDFDIFLVPGGPDAGESYYRGLGDAGYDKLKEYIMSQGNYFGICAGAYLPLTSLYEDNRYWLNLIDATDDEDLDYWRTGTGFVKIRITEPSHPFAFGLAAGGVNTLDCIYWEGPAIKALKDNVRVLATYDDFVASGTKADRPRWDLLDNEPAKEAINSWYNVLTRDRFDRYLRDTAAVVETKINDNKMLLYSHHAEFGNIGITTRRDSRIFQLITNGLFYLSI
jgi:hypothetical protein